MKTIKELRGSFDLHPQESGATLKYFKKYKIDFDVFLPTIGINLQRSLVWTLFQKRELIWSMLISRRIPCLTLINTWDEVWQVIDGKQRLTAMFDFIDDKFTLEVDGVEYLFSELPQDYQLAINNYHVRYYYVYEMQPPIPDDLKIEWFKLINFAGTPQDQEHLKNLTKNDN